MEINKWSTNQLLGNIIWRYICTISKSELGAWIPNFLRHISFCYVEVCWPFFFRLWDIRTTRCDKLLGFLSGCYSIGKHLDNNTDLLISVYNMSINRYIYIHIYLYAWNSEQPILNGCLLKKQVVSNIKIWKHPIETTMNKWMFQVPSIYICWGTSPLYIVSRLQPPMTRTVMNPLASCLVLSLRYVRCNLTISCKLPWKKQQVVHPWKLMKKSWKTMKVHESTHIGSMYGT